MCHENYLKLAIREADKGMNTDQGGPFGAIIVLNREIIGRGNNRVIHDNDPTAHAEVVAIRRACKQIEHFHLNDAILYASCEPCPMCLSAIYWAGIKEVYYSSDRDDAAHIGFGDAFIYDQLPLPADERDVKLHHIRLKEGDILFSSWLEKEDRRQY